ncbi:hypothetical protein FHU10_1229 [Serratia fonticola]|uniref:Uncharacterized protein n=1 Tax=Serratia fonticola TaxID=47917 RepID=A0A542BJI3_SERFO|nr:hypothetical protein [Serratia fonticola]TQI78730.1 hypothetical protein FHU09_1222 [Serratia fonticola]TQI99248.1 hypothetical protein FHU11_4830 [Serratia fonticola]TVZ68773.1 hypothetical protein FHU10_1229 [Serratia fonticola]
MNTANSMTININSMHIQQALMHVGVVMTRLTTIGFTVSQVIIEPQVKPTFVVQSDKYCRSLIESGEAFCFSRGQDGKGNFKKYQFNCLNSRIIWEER